MIEKRNIHRRQYHPFTQFPLYSQTDGLVLSERRTLPTRRVNDIEVEEISCEDFVSKWR
jgi:hypothetical protein